MSKFPSRFSWVQEYVWKCLKVWIDINQRKAAAGFLLTDKWKIRVFDYCDLIYTQISALETAWHKLWMQSYGAGLWSQHGCLQRRLWSKCLSVSPWWSLWVRGSQLCPGTFRQQFSPGIRVDVERLVRFHVPLPFDFICRKLWLQLNREKSCFWP